MGARLTPPVLAGFAVLDDRLHTIIADNDGDAVNSLYSEASPRPGVAVPRDGRARLLPIVSGDQGRDLEIVVLQAGRADLDLEGAVELGWRYAGESDELIRGWSPPTVVLGFDLVKRGDDAVPDRWDQFDAVVCRSQKIVCVYAGSTTGETLAQKVWDPSTMTWGAESTPFGAQNGNEGAALAALPSGRLFYLHTDALNSSRWNVYRSDDEGGSWELHSTNVFTPQQTPSFAGSRPEARGRLASDGETFLYFASTGSANTLKQYYSSDLLGHLVHVGDYTIGDAVSLAVVDGVYIVGYIRSSDGAAVVRRLIDPGQSLTDADQVVVRSGASKEIELCADPCGLLWAIVTDDLDRDKHRLYVSADGGESWEEAKSGCLRTDGGTSDGYVNMRALPVCGAVHLLSTAAASSSTDDPSIYHLILGGWGTLAVYAYATSLTLGYEYPRLINRSGFGTGTAGYTARCWTPIEEPGNGLYTANGAGTDTLTNGELVVSTAANQRFYDVNLGSGIADGVHSALFDVVLDSGGSLAADDVAAGIRVADGSNEVEIKVRLGPTGIRAVDSNAGTLATALLDTSEPLQIAISVWGRGLNTQRQAWVWYRRRTDTVWTELWSGQLVNDTTTPAAAGRIVWGHVASSTAESRWRIFQDGAGQMFAQGPVRLASNGLPYEAVLGKPCNPRPSPLPIEVAVPGGGTWGEAEVVHLSAVAGPGALGEIYDLGRVFDFPVTAADPVVEPSPSRTWRTRGLAEQRVCWDFTEATWMGDSVVLIAALCNFRLAYLEYWTTGTTWVTAGALDLATGFSALEYDLTGDCLTPASGTDPGARWLQEGELVGGHVLLDPGGTEIARRIRWNTAGAYGPGSTSTQKARILLEGIDGSEPSSGSCALVWPSGVLVVHHAALQVRRRWRVRIPAQTSPDAYYEAGCLVPAPLRAWGAAPDWGWSQESTPNVALTRSRSGTARGKKLGPPPRIWTFGWAEGGADLSRLRASLDQDYLGPSGGLPLAAAEDVPWTLRGLLELSQSGSVPVLAMSSIPDSSGTTITDRSLFNLGHLTSSVREDNMLGTEGLSERQRPATITIEGLV